MSADGWSRRHADQLRRSHGPDQRALLLPDADELTIPEHVQQIPNNVKRIADAHRQFRKEIPVAARARTSASRWTNGTTGTARTSSANWAPATSSRTRLGIAAGLHEYFRNSDIIFMANYAQTVNVIGCIKTTKTHAEFRLHGLPLMLYRQHFGTIPVKVEHQAAPLDISAAFDQRQEGPDGGGGQSHGQRGSTEVELERSETVGSGKDVGDYR